MSKIIKMMNSKRNTSTKRLVCFLLFSKDVIVMREELLLLQGGSPHQGLGVTSLVLMSNSPVRPVPDVKGLSLVEMSKRFE